MAKCILVKKITKRLDEFVSLCKISLQKFVLDLIKKVPVMNDGPKLCSIKCVLVDLGRASTSLVWCRLECESMGEGKQRTGMMNGWSWGELQTAPAPWAIFGDRSHENWPVQANPLKATGCVESECL